MAKVRECPECNCVMKCTAWHFEEDVGAKQGTGDFDCRNCDMILNNESDGVFTVSGYSTAIFDSLSDDKPFDEFMEEYSDE